MLLGLSNVLQMQIIVFTSIPSWPHFTIYPRCPLASKNPLYLAYVHGGCGHYCLATKQAETVAHKSQHTDENLRGTPTDSENVCTSCRCGRGRNSANKERVNCCENKSYSSRCPCLKAHSQCSDNCKCISCGNGKKYPEESETTLKNRRKRPRHVEQSKEEGWKFMKKENEQTLSGMWTPQEHYIFLSIVMSLRKSKSSASVEISDVSSLYDAVKEVVECDAIDIALSPKNDAQLRGKLNQLLKEEEARQVCGTINYLP